MFKDYYKLLHITPNATEEEIRTAFKTFARKYHPDRNLGKDTTAKMQNINEAYLILKDKEAKERYDVEYESYLNHLNNIKNKNKGNTWEVEDENYKVTDEILEYWIHKAQKQAFELLKHTVQDIKGITHLAFNSTILEIKNKTMPYFLLFLLVITIIGIAKLFELIFSLS